MPLNHRLQYRPYRDVGCGQAAHDADVDTCPLSAGALSQNAIFSVQPQALSVVHSGESVMLECITRSSVTCAWKLDAPDLGSDGFLNARVSVSRLHSHTDHWGRRGGFCPAWGRTVRCKRALALKIEPSQTVITSVSLGYAENW